MLLILRLMSFTPFCRYDAWKRVKRQAAKYKKRIIRGSARDIRKKNI